MAQVSTRPTSPSTCRSAPPRPTPRTSRPRPSCTGRDLAAARTGERRAIETGRRTDRVVHGSRTWLEIALRRSHSQPVAKVEGLRVVRGRGRPQHAGRGCPPSMPSCREVKKRRVFEYAFGVFMRETLSSKTLRHPRSGSGDRAHYPLWTVLVVVLVRVLPSWHLRPGRQPPAATPTGVAVHRMHAHTRLQPRKYTHIDFPRFYRGDLLLAKVGYVSGWRCARFNDNVVFAVCADFYR